MQKINWKAKLTSRKFWLATAAFIVGVLALFQVDANLVTQISGVIMSLGSVIAYIVGEGFVDASATGTIASAEPIAPLIGTVAPDPVEGTQTASDKAVTDNTASNPPTDTKAE